MNTGSNIDPIRTEIMRLESLLVFDGAGWERVLADLQAQGRTAAIADAERRMHSVMGRQEVFIEDDHLNFDLLFRGMGPIECYRAQQCVAAETETQ